MLSIHNYSYERARFRKNITSTRVISTIQTGRKASALRQIQAHSSRRSRRSATLSRLNALSGEGRQISQIYMSTITG